MNILRNPRVVTPASQRIHNWRALPVEGAGKPLLTAQRVDRACNLLLLAFALATAWLVASRGWAW